MLLFCCIAATACCLYRNAVPRPRTGKLVVSLSTSPPFRRSASSLVPSGPPPIPKLPELHDLPEYGIGHASRPVRPGLVAVRRPARRRSRVRSSTEEPRDGFGSIRPNERAVARQQRAESKQLLVVLQNVLLIGTGEAHAINDFQHLVTRDVVVPKYSVQFFPILTHRAAPAGRRRRRLPHDTHRILTLSYSPSPPAGTRSRVKVNAIHPTPRCASRPF